MVFAHTFDRTQLSKDLTSSTQDMEAGQGLLSRICRW